MNVSQVTLGSNVMSLGAILGTSGSQELLDRINARGGGGSFFNTDRDPFRDGFKAFMQTVVDPIRKIGVTLQNTANKLFRNDVITPIVCEEDLRWIPPKMHLPIVYYPPIRQMLEEERIDGFGIDPKTLAEEDPYADMCDSGVVDIHSSTLGSKGEYTVIHYESTTDPELTHDEVEAIRDTREFLGHFVTNEETSHFDPTNYPDIHC